jgi:hypothetical protein
LPPVKKPTPPTTPSLPSDRACRTPPHLSDSQATAAKGQSYPQVGYVAWNWPYWFPFIETQF